MMRHVLYHTEPCWSHGTIHVVAVGWLILKKSVMLIQGRSKISQICWKFCMLLVSSQRSTMIHSNYTCTAKRKLLVNLRVPQQIFSWEPDFLAFDSINQRGYDIWSPWMTTTMVSIWLMFSNLAGKKHLLVCLVVAMQGRSNPTLIGQNLCHRHLAG